ncbi:hypothetical protein [Haloferula rosea]|uniref:Uncharacterized protein n=1 Tax=Haloferula rosea TaxID=490093 RepID=A0A934RD84_9BACT|nr:hypothetical protein [Haloferula rosea]MBK1829057.1 hypothetical protein [Haloferula rosea]
MKTPQARDLAIGLRLGVIQPRDVVEWADSWIMRLDDPPYWLIEVSTSPRAAQHDLLNLIPTIATDEEVADQEFLGAMAVRLIDQAEPLGEILRLMYERFCLCEWTEMTEIRQQVYLIDDEWDWDQSRAIKTARTFLTPHLEAGRSLLEKIKSEQAVDARP